MNDYETKLNEMRERWENGGWMCLEKMPPENVLIEATWDYDQTVYVGKRQMNNFVMEYDGEITSWNIRQVAFWRPLPAEPQHDTTGKLACGTVAKAGMEVVCVENGPHREVSGCDDKFKIGSRHVVRHVSAGADYIGFDEDNYACWFADRFRAVKSAEPQPEFKLAKPGDVVECIEESRVGSSGKPGDRFIVKDVEGGAEYRFVGTDDVCSVKRFRVVEPQPAKQEQPADTPKMAGCVYVNEERLAELEQTMAEHLQDIGEGHFCDLFGCSEAGPLVKEIRRLQPYEQRVKELESAIRTHRDQKADDRCIEDDDRLYEALGDGIKCDRAVGDKAAMLENCLRFINHRCSGGGPWKSYAELEQEIRTLRTENSRLAHAEQEHLLLSRKLEKENAELRAQYDKLGIDCRDTILRLEQRIAKQRERIEELEREIPGGGAMNVHAENMRKMWNGLRFTGWANMANQCRDAADEINRLEAALETCRNGSDALEKGLASLNEALTEKDKRIERLTGDAGAWNKAYHDANNDRLEAERKICELNKRIVELEQAMAHCSGSCNNALRRMRGEP